MPALADTTTAEFEVLAVERVTGKDRLYALALVEVVIDGVPIFIQGMKVLRQAKGWGVEVPCYRHGAESVPAIILPAELGEAIGQAILTELGI